MNKLQKEIILSDSLKQILKKHAQNYQPNESCALLFGKEDNNKIQVREAFLAENTEKSPVNFTISNEELIDAYQTAERKKLDVVGVFHSHPNSDAYPSETDKEFMHTNPVVWIIFSGTSKDFKAFILEDEIIEIPIVST